MTINTAERLAKQREYNRNYQNRTRKEKNLTHFGCLLTKDEYNKVSSLIPQGQSIKQWLLNMIDKK